VSRGRLAVALLAAAAVSVFFAAGGHRYLSLDHLKAQQAALQDWRAAHPAGSAAAFFAAYVAVTGLSLPGAALLTLLAGALFGLLWGTIIVSFASSMSLPEWRTSAPSASIIATLPLTAASDSGVTP